MQAFNLPNVTLTRLFFCSKSILACVLVLWGALSFPLTTALAETQVGGPITQNTTWTLADSPYIVTGGVVVDSGVTLTIGAGVIVRLNSAGSLQINGALIAVGEEAQPITFTSNQTEPAPGDWGYIYFTNTSTDAAYDGGGNYTGGSILEYCTVAYAGAADINYNGAIRMENAHPFINRCTIENNATSGIYAWELSETLKITNNIIRNNSTTADCSYYGGGIYTHMGTVTIAGNHISGNTANNSGGGINVFGGTITISGNVIRDNEVLGNWWDNGGGGIFVGSANLVVSNVTITNNIILNNSVASNGGGIYIHYWRSTATISNNVIAGNTAAWSGGGIQCYYCFFS